MSYVLIDEKRLERISEVITFIADFIRSIFEEKTKQDTDRLLTNTEAAELLNISKRTLARMRTKGSIAYSIVEGSCRYSYQDVLDAVERCKIKAAPRTQTEFEQNYHAIISKRNAVWKR
jgi:excisionase family DNA binding protein